MVDVGVAGGEPGRRGTGSTYPFPRPQLTLSAKRRPIPRIDWPIPPRRSAPPLFPLARFISMCPRVRMEADGSLRVRTGMLSILRNLLLSITTMHADAQAQVFHIRRRRFLFVVENFEIPFDWVAEIEVEFSNAFPGGVLWNMIESYLVSFRMRDGSSLPLFSFSGNARNTLVTAALGGVVIEETSEPKMEANAFRAILESLIAQDHTLEEPAA